MKARTRKESGKEAERKKTSTDSSFTFPLLNREQKKKNYPYFNIFSIYFSTDMTLLQV